MLVSVVTPAYNCRELLRQTVQAVIRQTYQRWEMIIVDDCSTDGTLELARQFAARDSRIRVLHNETNQGVALTRNRGIGEAAGAYIALLDGDDLWEPDKLERQVRLMQEGYDLVYCSYDFRSEDGVPLVRMRPFIVPRQTSFRKMLRSSVVSCSTVMARAALFKEHPFRADVYHEDYTLWMELFGLPIRAAGDPKVLMHYRLARHSRSNPKWRAAKERWRIYREVLKLGLWQSLRSFLGYALCSARKYYLGGVWLRR